MLSTWISHLTGMALFEGRLFRAGAAAMTSIILVMSLMPRYIRYLQGLNASSDFENKSGQAAPPILGGVLLVIIVVFTSLLFCLGNGYVISTLIIMVAYAAVGALDDVAKIRNKRLVAQGKLTPAEYMEKADGISSTLRLALYFLFSTLVAFLALKKRSNKCFWSSSEIPMPWSFTASVIAASSTFVMM